MKIIILGCSPILAGNLCFNCSGYLVDSEILFDCGPGIWRALCQMSIPCSAINSILLSHFHIDHTSDLPAILLARYLSPQAQRPLQIIGPRGLKKWFTRLTEIIGSWSRAMNLELLELDHSVMVKDYKVTAAPTLHTDNSICFRLVDRFNRVFFYSGDSDFNKSLVQNASNADIAVVECSNTTETKTEGHLTPELAAQIAEEAQVKHLVLTHMYPEVRMTDATTSVKKYYNGILTLAHDGLTFEI